MFSIFLAAMLLGVAVAAPVGPVATAAIRHGLTGGATQTFWFGQGAALTDLFYILATYAGLTPLLARFTWLPLALYFVGTVMIGRMAWGALREALWAPPGEVISAGSVSPNPWHRTLRLGLGLTLVNPATITAWLTLGGSFISKNLAGRSPGESILLLSGIWAGSALWFVVLSLIVGVARVAAVRKPWLFRAVGGLSGVVLLGFAVGFGYQFSVGLLALWQG